jgi:1-aminocyclopropane-1-carboxylate deaminase/D-cysteine desulfhydrase-like pyridoxal-dependent ACC family enzyme
MRWCVRDAGAWQSNHCRATAAAARELGIECHLILRTDYTTDNIPITGNVALDMMMNAQLHLVSVAEYNQVRIVTIAPHRYPSLTTCKRHHYTHATPQSGRFASIVERLG